MKLVSSPKEPGLTAWVSRGKLPSFQDLTLNQLLAMEQPGKVYKRNYLAEIMSDSYRSMTNKHRIPEKEESSFCGKGSSYPC